MTCSILPTHFSTAPIAMILHMNFRKPSYPYYKLSYNRLNDHGKEAVLHNVINSSEYNSI